MRACNEKSQQSLRVQGRRSQRHCQFQSLQNIACYIFLLTQVLGVVSDYMEPTYPEPVFLPRLLDVTVREGGRAVLPCAVHFLGTKQVTWRRMGDTHFLSVGGFLWVKDPNLNIQYNEITPEVTEWNLEIKKVKPEHSGVYECKISDVVPLIRNVTLNVTGPPIVEPVSRPPIIVSGKNYVERGQSIHLYCNATSQEGIDLSIRWFKDGDRIDPASYKHVVITNYNLVEQGILVSELFIDRSQSSDTGTYICRSSADYIDSIKVTVLFADTTNVKRGDPSEGPDNQRLESSTTRPQCLVSALVLGLMLSLSLS
ncbi:zwei Ig domain protein zig-8-like isoform X2 [Physella acuta]|uniref:zwei Ig domain protein zig-8-like isoform X2 n=1 Tax=Physella acuta TaxID=109671 RepID=UPI0027DDE050|nr:zwei Ig domain protein zig-8-like isoform X2 [Physella acuta]